MNQVYGCPVCHLALEKLEKQYVCPNKHTFDIAREGYVNLLLAHRKRTREPGDSKAMIESRRDFLNKGYYDILSGRLNEVMAAELSDTQEGTHIHILDAGCGEGYFIGQLKRQLQAQYTPRTFTFWGIDISKPAIKYAVRRDKGINFAVASTYDLPILSSCLDGIVRILAPGDEAQFRRVLKSSGKLVTVVPGPKHLFGLKQLIYETPRQHDEEEAIPEGFELSERARITYGIHLKASEDIVNLLAMTPYYWHIDPTTQGRVEARSELQTEVDFIIAAYRKLPHGSPPTG